ncbi:MAG: hypothetical protein ACRD3C_16865 [Vicinamibacterales bacterium]
MPQLMTTNALVTCPHGGKGTSIPSSPKWSIQGGFVLREGDTGVLSCGSVPPCVSYVLKSMHLNATVIDGVPAVLVTDFNQTLTGLPLTIVETHSTLDNSTPAPVPAGSDAPPLSPELLDTTPPIVVPLLPAAAFSSTTMLPVTLPLVFTLASPFPLKWVLTRESKPPNADAVDLTNGEPPLAVVTPPGGAWTTPVLMVTLTLSAAYMAGLGMGIHRFHMTGVNQRGLWASDKSELTVS